MVRQRRVAHLHVPIELMSLANAELDRQVMEPRAIQAVQRLETAGRVWNSSDVGHTQGLVRRAAATVSRTCGPGPRAAAGRG